MQKRHLLPLVVILFVGVTLLGVSGCAKEEESTQKTEKVAPPQEMPAPQPTVEEEKAPPAPPTEEVAKVEAPVEEAPPQATPAGDINAGKAIYEGVCVACHGPGGVAAIPGVPSFAKGEAAGGMKLADRSDDQLKESIKNGIMSPKTPGAPPMPPFGGGSPLNDKQLADIIAYIRSLKQ